MKVKEFIHHLLAVAFMAAVDFLAVSALLCILSARYLEEIPELFQDGISLEMQGEQIGEAAGLLKSDYETMVQEKLLAEQRENQLSSSEIEKPSVGDYMGQIVVEGADVDLPLYFGDTPAILHKGAGTYAGSVLPGFTGLTLVCSHNGAGQFGRLGEVEEGERIQITMPYGDYEYQIDEIKVVDSRDPTAYDFTVTKDQLIVYTCYPLYYSGATNDRLFLYCTRVSGKEVVESEE